MVDTLTTHTLISGDETTDTKLPNLVCSEQNIINSFPLFTAVWIMCIMQPTSFPSNVTLHLIKKYIYDAANCVENDRRVFAGGKDADCTTNVFVATELSCLSSAPLTCKTLPHN